MQRFHTHNSNIGIQVLFWWTGIALIVLGILQLVRAFQFGRGVTAPPAP